MSTEIFRKYIDLLNESISDTDQTLIDQALDELERVLNRPKYQGKIRSYFGEDAHLLEVDIYIPPESSARTAAQQAAMDAERLGTAPVTRPPPPPPPPPPPSAISKAASKGLDVGTKVIKNPYARVGAVLAATVYAIVKQWDFISSLNFSDLDHTDQDTINKNLKILDPFIKPEVITQLPDKTQDRIKRVLDLLAKLGKGVPSAAGKPGGLAARQRLAKTLPGETGDPTPVPDTPVKTGAASLSPGWTNDGKATPDDIKKFLDAIKNAEQYVSDIRESKKRPQSRDMSQLSGVETMAILRDKLKEDGIGDLSFWSSIAGWLGIGAVGGGIQGTYAGLKQLWSKFEQEVPAMADSSLPLETRVAGFKSWIKSFGPVWAKAKGRAALLGLGTMAMDLFWNLWQIYGVYSVGRGAGETIKDLGKDNNALENVYDMYLQMPPDVYKNLLGPQKDQLQAELLAYCKKFPKDHHCSTIINQICGPGGTHPEWPGCLL